MRRCSSSLPSAGTPEAFEADAKINLKVHITPYMALEHVPT